MFYFSRGGNRGGKDQFKWEDVKHDKYKEFYLGHSVHTQKATFNNPKPNAGWWERSSSKSSTSPTSASTSSPSSAGSSGSKSSSSRSSSSSSRSRRKRSNEAEAEIALLKQQELLLLNQALGIAPKTTVVNAKPLDKGEIEQLTRRGATERDDEDDANRIGGLGYEPAFTHEGVKQAEKPSLNEEIDAIEETKNQQINTNCDDRWVEAGLKTPMRKRKRDSDDSNADDSDAERFRAKRKKLGQYNKRSSDASKKHKKKEKKEKKRKKEKKEKKRKNRDARKDTQDINSSRSNSSSSSSRKDAKREDNNRRKHKKERAKTHRHYHDHRDANHKHHSSRRNSFSSSD